MVRKPPAVLIQVAAALAALAAFDLAAPHIAGSAGTALQLAGLSLISIPLATLVPRAMRPPTTVGVQLLGAFGGAAAITALLIWTGHPDTPATLAKLCAASVLGLALGSLLQNTAEIIGIAILIAAVDIYSVSAGPTKLIVEHHVEVLNAFTLAFHPLGSQGVVQIGVSDFIFFAVFLAAADRFHLRRDGSWLAMTASFGATLTFAYLFDRAVPALPLLSLSFLVVNAGPLRARLPDPRGGRR